MSAGCQRRRRHGPVLTEDKLWPRRKLPRRKPRRRRSSLPVQEARATLGAHGIGGCSGGQALCPLRRMSAVVFCFETTRKSRRGGVFAHAALVITVTMERTSGGDTA